MKYRTTNLLRDSEFLELADALWKSALRGFFRMELANNQLAATNAQMAKRLRIDPAALEKA